LPRFQAPSIIKETLAQTLPHLNLLKSVEILLRLVSFFLAFLNRGYPTQSCLHRITINLGYGLIAVLAEAADALFKVAPGLRV
jgi:hypothetical protein